MSESTPTRDLRQEVERIKRVSDMLVTAHSFLREKWSRRALYLDVAILALTVWLTAVVFIEPRLSLKLTPFHLDPQIWIGILGVFTLFLSVVQLRVYWKGRSEAHGRSATLYAKIKGLCRRLLESNSILTEDNCQQLFTQYELSAEVGCAVPEPEFLKQKQRHLRKLELSRFLDAHPSASLRLARIRFWWHANVGSGKGHE